MEPDLLLDAFEDQFAGLLPESAPTYWDFASPEPIEGDEGDEVSFSLSIRAFTPGRTLFAVEVRSEATESTAGSEILGIEVTEDLEILLLTDVEPMGVPV
jgi:hypothetical protein